MDFPRASLCSLGARLVIVSSSPFNPTTNKKEKLDFCRNEAKAVHKFLLASPFSLN